MVSIITSVVMTSIGDNYMGELATLNHVSFHNESALSQKNYYIFYPYIANSTEKPFMSPFFARKKRQTKVHFRMYVLFIIPRVTIPRVS